MEEQTLRISLEKFVQAFKSLASKLYEAFKSFWNKVKLVVIKHYQLEEKPPVAIRNTFKLDFTRPLIKHQVTNNKPRYAVRKVIKG